MKKSTGYRVVGKPEDEADARRILKWLSGRVHELWTGVCLWRVSDGWQLAWQEVSRVQMRPLSDEELQALEADILKGQTELLGDPRVLEDTSPAGLALIFSQVLRLVRRGVEQGRRSKGGRSLKAPKHRARRRLPGAASRDNRVHKILARADARGVSFPAAARVVLQEDPRWFELERHEQGKEIERLRARARRLKKAGRL